MFCKADNMDAKDEKLLSDHSSQVMLEEENKCMLCIINDAVSVILLYVTANCHDYPEGEEMSTQQSTTMTELGMLHIHFT